MWMQNEGLEFCLTEPKQNKHFFWIIELKKAKELLKKNTLFYKGEDWW